MNDTIYRDEAIEICERWRQRAKEHHDRNGWYMADILLRFMKEMPSANRPQGEWIPCTKGGLPLTELGRRERQKWYGYKCSKCNFIYKGNALTESPFCQNCGARMEKIGEELQTCESQDEADCTNCNLTGEDKCWDCVIKEE